MIDDWYSYGQFKFTREQIEWGIHNIKLLKTGYWVPPPKGYADRVGHTALKNEAYYIKPEIIAAEIEARLEMAGRDGSMCKHYFCDGDDERTLSIDFGCPIWRVKRRIERAMRYMSGKRRKRISYQDWIRNGWKYYKKLKEVKDGHK